MASLYTHQTQNIWKTWLLMAAFLGLLIAVGFALGVLLDSPGILYIAVVFSLFMNIGAYWWSDKLVIKMTHAKEASEKQFPELHRIVENLSITAGLPKPRVYIVEEAQPNAFATGRNKDNAVVAVTTGLLDRLDRSELEGVIAHELAHIGNRDMLVSTVAVVLAGVIAIVADLVLRFTLFGGRSNNRNAGGLALVVALIAIILAPIAATLIRMAVSRKREYLADATGVLLTRYPEGLATALEKIAADPHKMKHASNATAHLFFASPFKGRQAKSFFAKLFMTHPPVEERVKALRGLNME